MSATPRYDLTTDEIAELTAAVLRRYSPDLARAHRFVTVELSSQDPASNVARTVERTVFESTFGNDTEEMTREYRLHEQTSLFFLIIDRAAMRPAGLMRIIRHGDAGLKSVNDLKGEPFCSTPAVVAAAHHLGDFRTTWDLGTLAVLPEYRSGAGAASVQLYRAVYLAAIRDGIEHFVTIIDWAPLQKLTRYVGIPFEPLAQLEPAPYLGSERSQPAYGYVPDFYRLMNRKRFTIRGFLARKALGRLVLGTDDPAIWLDDTAT